MELKIIKDGFSFPFSRLETHQYDNLWEVRKNGGKAFVGVLFRRTLTSSQQKKYKVESRLLDEAFMIPIEVMEDWLDQDIKSVSLATLRQCGKLPRDGKNWLLDSLTYG